LQFFAVAVAIAVVFAVAVAIAIAVVFVIAVILNAVKDPEELRSPQPPSPFHPHTPLCFSS
jgi:hypothetical protein